MSSQTYAYNEPLGVKAFRLIEESKRLIEEKREKETLLNQNHMDIKEIIRVLRGQTPAQPSPVASAAASIQTPTASSSVNNPAENLQLPLSATQTAPMITTDPAQIKQLVAEYIKTAKALDQALAAQANRIREGRNLNLALDMGFASWTGLGGLGLFTLSVPLLVAIAPLAMFTPLAFFTPVVGLAATGLIAKYIGKRRRDKKEELEGKRREYTGELLHIQKLSEELRAMNANGILSLSQDPLLRKTVADSQNMLAKRLSSRPLRKTYGAHMSDLVEPSVDQPKRSLWEKVKAQVRGELTLKDEIIR